MTVSPGHTAVQAPVIAERALMAAFVIALVATLAVLFIGEVMGQMACTLCWYQRIAMFPLVPILGITLWRADLRGEIYAWPLAVAGILLAAWHAGLYAGILPQAIIPCSADGPSCTGNTQIILGLPIPYLSLGTFAAIISCLFIAWRTRS
jgi:disulfide bond formation protein DsbB